MKRIKTPEEMEKTFGPKWREGGGLLHKPDLEVMENMSWFGKPIEYFTDLGGNIYTYAGIKMFFPESMLIETKE